MWGLKFTVSIDIVILDAWIVIVIVIAIVCREQDIVVSELSDPK